MSPTAETEPSGHEHLAVAREGAVAVVTLNRPRVLNALNSVLLREFFSAFAALDADDETARFLKDIDLSDDELAKSIIGTIGDIDHYELPDAKGYSSMVHYLSGETDEDRQTMREEVLNTTAKHFESFAQALEGAKEKGLVKLLGSQNTIQEALSDRPGWLNVLKVL